MVTSIIYAAAVVGILGMLIGVFLGIASEKFKVEVDERELLVRDELPGNNCGGCGYAGCDALAKAIAGGEASVSACPVGGTAAAEKIGKIMGVAAIPSEKKVAFVKCKGTYDKTKFQYNYYGLQDCRKLSVVPGAGEKACSYGCMGYGSCVRACEFDAIHVIDGVAVVDKEKCVACGKCVSACPKNLIDLVLYKAEHLVWCNNSRDKGKNVKAICEAGCIACTLCIRQCKFDAIHMNNNVAVIDYEKCTNCGKCAEKCPVQVIV